MYLTHLCLGITLAAAPGSSSTETAPLPGPAAPVQIPSQAIPPSKRKPTRPNLEQAIKNAQEKEREAAENAGPLYVFPGVVRLQDNKWVGYDFLYNMTNSIPIEVTIVKPPDATIPVNDSAIRERIAAEFQKAGISTAVTPEAGRPPVAIFDMMILIYPLNDGFIALCDGRLLETVELKRATLDPAEGIFQAVTWEQKNLVVSSSSGFLLLMDKTIDDIIQTFIDRYKFYKNLKRS